MTASREAGPAEPEIKYCTTRDGVRIAFFTLGEGPPLVHMPPFPLSHIRVEYHGPSSGPYYQALGRNSTLVRYDRRGAGLSDRDTGAISMDTHLLDLEAVVDSLRFERFALMGFSHSCPAAIAFAARFPERVTHLVLWNGYANAADYARASRVEAARSLIEQDWQLYTESEGYRFTEWSGGEDAKWYTEYIRQSVTPETLRAMFDLIRGTNVTDLLPEVAAPTLVLHRRELSVLTVETAKDLTASIPDARLIIVDGVSIAPFMEGTTEVVVGAIDAFLAETGAPSVTAPPSDVSPAALTPRETEILALIARGRSSADVSRELSLSIRTVGRHITNIYAKIGARTRADATAYAIRNRIA